MRFVLEVLDRVRSKVGIDYPITIRLNGDDFIEGGISIEYALRVLKELDKAGIDGFHITGEIYESFPKGKMISPMSIPPAPLVELAAAVKRVTSKPVIAWRRSTGLNLWKMYYSKIKRISLLWVALSHPDPELPNKVIKGHMDEINYCITCQGCQERLFSN